MFSWTQDLVFTILQDFPVPHALVINYLLSSLCSSVQDDMLLRQCFLHVCLLEEWVGLGPNALKHYQLRCVRK